MNVSFITFITFLVASCAQTLGETVLELAEKLGAKTLVKLVTDSELADTLSGPGRYDNKTADKVKRIHLKNVNYSYFKIDHLMLMCMFYIWSYLPDTSMSTSCYIIHVIMLNDFSVPLIECENFLSRFNFQKYSRRTNLSRAYNLMVCKT